MRLDLSHFTSPLALVLTSGVGVKLFGLNLYADYHDGTTIPYCLSRQMAAVGWIRRSCVAEYSSSFNAHLNVSPIMIGF